MRLRRSLFPLLVIIVLVGGYVAGCASGSGQPHMVAARDELRAARGELEAAEANKGGHRERAIALVDDAINQVNEGINFAASH